MAGITLKQAEGSTVLPKDDAILYDMIVDRSGYIYGCELTWQGGNQIHIGAGYGIIKGRIFEIEEQTIYAKLPNKSGVTYLGLLVIEVDLAQTTDPIAIQTYCNDMTEKDGYLEQDEDFNYNNGIWELEAAEYRATSTGIISFTPKWEKVERPYKIISNFSDFSSLNENGYLLDALIQKQRILTFKNVSVPVSSWLENDTYEDYPYRAAIGCNGVSSDYVPSVVFDLSDATSGNFAPIAETATGTILLYANKIPSAAITIPVIQCIRTI